MRSDSDDCDLPTVPFLQPPATMPTDAGLYCKDVITEVELSSSRGWHRWRTSQINPVFKVAEYEAANCCGASGDQHADVTAPTDRIVCELSDASLLATCWSRSEFMKVPLFNTPISW
eukprot:GHVN01051201.1.p2 GENE.GHVN01051201.1~~GHVN01051201.1.p2  ORF type:complete len:117 (-),score=12.41 GHVN01051201.1:675-1025(-)